MSVPMHCVGTGWCCMSGPCPMGIRRGVPTRGPCPRLVAKGGRHWCGFVLDSDNPPAELAEIRAGTGCAKPLSPQRIARL